MLFERGITDAHKLRVFYLKSSLMNQFYIKLMNLTRDKSLKPESPVSKVDKNKRKKRTYKKVK